MKKARDSRANTGSEQVDSRRGTKEWKSSGVALIKGKPVWRSTCFEKREEGETKENCMEKEEEEEKLSHVYRPTVYSELRGMEVV